jgi:GAF domain-containing protein
MDSDIRDTAIPSQILEIWQRVVNSAAALLAVPSVMINRLEPPDLAVFRSNVGPENPFPTGTHIPMMGLYCEATARRRQRLEVNDAREDPIWSQSPTAKAGIFAYLGYPIMWPDGGVFGTLCAVDTKENKWGGEADSLLLTCRDAIEAHLALVLTLEQLNQRNRELEAALGEVRTLRGLLPICATCKKVRDDRGYWAQIDSYVVEHSDVKFSHAICPDCAASLYPELDIYRDDPWPSEPSEPAG